MSTLPRKTTVSHRDARAGRHANGTGDAGHNLPPNAGRCAGSRLLATTPEDEGIAGP